MRTTGLTLGTSAASESGAGLTWSNPTNVLTLGTPRATVSFTKNDQASNVLVVSGFQLPIPVGSTIVGIAVELKYMQNQGGAAGHIASVILRDATGDNSTLNFAGTTFATNDTLTFGGSANLWAPTRPWTYLSIAASTFAVAVTVGAASSGTSLQTVGIGTVRLNVWSEDRTNALRMGSIGIGLWS